MGYQAAGGETERGYYIPGAHRAYAAGAFIEREDSRVTIIPEETGKAGREGGDLVPIGGKMDDASKAERVNDPRVFVDTNRMVGGQFA